MNNIQEKPNKIHLQEPQVHRFVNYCLQSGAIVTPILINEHDPMWPGWCNPSIMWDEKDQNFKMIVRNVNHVLHGVDNPIKAPCNWGPIFYSIPAEDGRNLKTQNFIGVCKDPAKEPWEFKKIKTNPYKPIWEFQGEEDARIVRWDGKLYATGVRRDDNTQGRGRMELMHLSENGYQEVTRKRVGAVNEDSYCEKNWMAIKDMPYHYVQQTNPTVVVKTDPKTGRTEEVVRKQYREDLVDQNFDLLRGSSTVIRWHDHWLALVHTCEMWITAAGRKYSRYCHTFVEWDDDWNIVKMSPLFSFADWNVEFTCGLEYHDGMFYIPFAIEDNFSFVISVKEEAIRQFIDNDESVGFADNEPAVIYTTPECPIYLRIFEPLHDGIMNQGHMYKAGMWYFDRGYFAASYDIFTRACEIYDETYKERFMAARSIANLGHRDGHEIAMWYHCIMHDDTRPEGYMGAAMYYKYRGGLIEALYHVRKAMECYEKMGDHDLFYYDKDQFMNLYYETLMESPYYDNAVEYYDAHGFNHENDRRAL